MLSKFIDWCMMILNFRFIISFKILSWQIIYWISDTQNLEILEISPKNKSNRTWNDFWKLCSKINENGKNIENKTPWSSNFALNGHTTSNNNKGCLLDEGGYHPKLTYQKYNFELFYDSLLVIDAIMRLKFSFSLSLI